MAENEFRIVGPPGTGKTTYLAREVRAAVRRYAPEKVLLASMTRAAAAEIAGRDLPVPPSGIGTLHAHAYRALGGNMTIAESPEPMADWNLWVSRRNPALRLTVHGAKKAGQAGLDEFDDEPQSSGTLGDALLSEFSVLRARMVGDEVLAHTRAGAFGKLWTEWKIASQCPDFTDLIEWCLRDVDAAPGAPDAIFLDEAQDSSALEFALARKWAGKAQALIVAGDPDQVLFRWRGASPEAFMQALPEGRERILEQSYRVPRAVHRAAMRWIAGAHGRREVAYLPRDFDGAVRMGGIGVHDYRQPGKVIAHFIEPLLAGNRDESPEDAARPVVMVLASCSYMIDPIKHALRDAGIPFANPWRRRRHDWNPLFAPSGTGSAERLLAFLRPLEEAWGAAAGDWTARDLRLWLAAIRTTGLITKRGRDYLMGLPEESVVSWEQLASIFNEQAIGEVVMADLQGALRWYESRLTKGRESGMAFPVHVARTRSPADLQASPRVVIGTIHSCKGAEAKHVLLWPDLSPQGEEEFRFKGPEARNSIIRMFYVGMTRARETLALLPPAGGGMLWAPELARG